MAKQYEAFTKEFAEVQKEVAAGAQEIKNHQNALAQTSGMVEEGTKELGLRIQQLKTKGMQGTKLDDFKSDKEVQTIMAGIHARMQQIEKELNKVSALHTGSFQKTRTRFETLKKELKKDIDDRKKSPTTLVGSGNKSLPDLQKLMATVNTYYNDHFGELRLFQPGKMEFQKKQLEEWISEQLSKTKSAALSEFQEMMMKQGLNQRIVIGKFNRVKALFDQYKVLVGEIQAAAAAGKSTELLNAQAKLIPAKNELDEIVQLYDRALKDTWISSQLNTSDAKSAILPRVQAMLKMKAETDKDFTVVAHLKARPQTATRP